jgi:hypothetical protein
LSTEDLEDYESEVELQLYREYKDVCPMFTYWVEAERRSYLANHVDVQVRAEGGRTWFEVELRDAWVLDMFRTNRFLPSVRLLSFKDVVVEELPKDLEDLASLAGVESLPGDPDGRPEPTAEASPERSPETSEPPSAETSEPPSDETGGDAAASS